MTDTALEYAATTSTADDRERLSNNFSRMMNATLQVGQPYDLGNKLQSSRRRYNRLDELSLEFLQNEHVEKNICRDAESHEFDREWALRQLISFSPAVTIEDALVQVAECITAVDLIWDQFPKESENFSVMQDYRRLDRLLYSVLRFLKSQAKQDVEEHCNSLGRDPWVEAEEAISQYRIVSAGFEEERRARLQRRNEREKAATT